MIFDSRHLQALYYWLRTYLLERRDVANKSEISRLAMAYPRMQQNVTVAGGGSINLGEGNARAQSQVGDNQIHQGTQSGGGNGSHDGVSFHVQEAERSISSESNVHPGTEQPMQQSSSAVFEGAQNSVRRNDALGLVAAAASAFDAAKDVMEALRSKHPNLANELEVIVLRL